MLYIQYPITNRKHSFEKPFADCWCYRFVNGKTFNIHLLLWIGGFQHLGRIPFEWDKKPILAKIVYNKNILFTNLELYYQCYW